MEYNDFIIESINKLDTAYMNSLDVEKGKEYCLKKCETLVQQCDQYIASLKGIQPYEGDSTFSMQAIAYVQFMKNNGKNDIPKFLQLIDRFEAVKTQEEIDQINSELEVMGTKLDDNYGVEMAKVQKVQAALAKKFNFTVLPG